MSGSDGRMWSGEPKAQKSRHTSDNNAAWLQTGAFPGAVLLVPLLGCLFTPSGIRSVLDRTIEMDVQRPKMEWKGLGHPSICLPETKWVRSASDVRLINQSNCLPQLHNNVHSFWSPARIIGKEHLFDSATIVTWLTAQNCTGKRGNL